MVFSRVPFPKNLNLLTYSKTSYIKDTKLATSLVEKLKLKDYYKDDCKVLDVYSNNLVFSTALYNHLEPSQHLLMEKRKEYYNHAVNHLQELGEGQNFQIQGLNPFDWSSYLHITDEAKIFQPEVESRDHIHSKFLFTGAVCEEGLIMQWLHCLGHQNWIQRFGNVKMLLWIPQSTAVKITAPSNSKARAKCSIVCQTFSDTKLIAISNTPDKSKYSPDVLSRDAPEVLDVKSFTAKLPMALVEIDPNSKDVEDMYNWEFITKNIMILKHQKLSESVKNLGPGAEEYFNQVIPKEKLNMKVYELETDDFIMLTREFEKWPFKPNTMMDFMVE